VLPQTFQIRPRFGEPDAEVLQRIDGHRFEVERAKASMSARLERAAGSTEDTDRDVRSLEMANSSSQVVFSMSSMERHKALHAVATREPAPACCGINER
jgi:hypothetical protein